ncbi:MAG: glycosyltransferase family 4 protein, partial [Candidatus Zixiibacteriota bacterium]
LEELLRRLVDYGHKVTLFCSGYNNCLPEEDIEGIKIIRRGNRFSFNLIAPFYLRKLVSRNQYDILIEDINKIPFYTPLYLNIKTLVVVPHLFATTVFHEINFILGSYIYLAEKPMVAIYKGLPFNVISESTADDINKRGIPPKDISVIHCGINRKLYAFDDEIIKYEKPTILYLGRIKKYKSIQHLIKAFKIVKEKLPDSKLMIVGNGDYLDKLKSLSNSLQLENDIEFTGFVATEEKVNRLRKAHVAVLPSLKEGWGLTNIEANSVGTSVIAADVPGLRDSVQEGVTGYLYEYGDIEQLADKLLTILTDKSLREKLEKGGMEWSKKFNWDNAAKKFESLLLEVVDKN